MPDDSIRIRQFASLQYYNPATVLRGVREIERSPGFAALPDEVRQLRTLRHRTWREGRIGALFAYGVGRCVLDCDVSIALAEAEDYDFVTRWRQDREDFFCPVQEKEWPSEQRNPDISLNDVLALLAESPVPTDTVALVQLNGRRKLDLGALQVPQMNFRELWFIGGGSEDQNDWFLLGDLLNAPRRFDFTYPS